jgi:ribosomal protein L1
LAFCRADKGGVVHAGLGKVSFDPDAIQANIAAFTAAIMAARPKGVKGATAGGYILSATLSSTMGPGVPVSLPALIAAGQSVSKSK